MLLKSINVQWKTNDSPIYDHSRFHWSAPNLTLSDTHQNLENQLNWPIGTIDALRAAFSSKLSRFDTWNISDMSDQQQQSLKNAAKYYKRGVPWINNTGPSPQNMQSGSYGIDIYSQETTLTKIIQQVDAAESFIIIDRHVYDDWNLGDTFADAFLIDATEEHKNLSLVASLAHHWRTHCPQKKTWVIIGGGIVGDVGAFAAAIFNIPFCLVPTSLLAMADACIGGKTGVNFPPFGKNQIGAFAFPHRVIVWPGWLKTLDERQLRSGAAECLKHCFLSGDTALVEHIINALDQKSLAEFDHILPDIILIKAATISTDADERGVRAILNLGHTLAHALEALSAQRQCNNPTILHGEAVAIGLAFSTILSNSILSLPDSDLNYIGAALQRSSCLPSLPTMQKYMNSPALFTDDFFEALFQFIEQDKKNHIALTRQSQWILLERLGKVHCDNNCYTTTVEYQDLKKSWLLMRQHLTGDQS